MKVLWYVNIVMPAAAKALALPATNAGGWLSGLLQALAGAGVQLTVLAANWAVKEERSVVVNGVRYVILPAGADLISAFQRLFEEVRPDLVHIHGTEYKNNTDLIEYCNTTGIRNVVSLQGVMSECAAHYCDGLPPRLCRVNPIVKLMKKVYTAESIAIEQRSFYEQGVRETRALGLARNVIGRTHWDKACALQCNPEVRYFHVNENLRQEFYSGEHWYPDRCEQHSIFISQAGYPIKGLHQFLPAFAELAKRYPDVRLYIGGALPYTLHHKLLDLGVDYFFEYQGYIKKLIRRYGLQNHIVYTGPLDAQQMKKRFLASHVFVSASTIENSPNSVGEAMLLGVPVVASNVGGTATMLRDGTDGILYDFADTDALADAIGSIFEDDALAVSFSENAREHAQKTHNREQNAAEMQRVYRMILEE